jgi:hypothetical protein
MLLDVYSGPYSACFNGANCSASPVIRYAINQERDVFDLPFIDIIRPIANNLYMSYSICNCLNFGLDSFVAGFEKGAS